MLIHHFCVVEKRNKGFFILSTRVESSDKRLSTLSTHVESLNEKKILRLKNKEDTEI
jgi:hypothetical protein